MRGYIKVPRDLFTSEEWLTPRVFGKVDAQLDLLSMASYIDGRVVNCAGGSVVLQKGQLLTSMRWLAERWGWSASSVYRYLGQLRIVRDGCIRISIETTAESGKTLITILDYDRWGINDETAFETQAETPNETQTETAFETPTKSISRCNAEGNIGNCCCRETPDETTFETESETRFETPNETINKQRDIKERLNNTHTVDTVKGVVGGNGSSEAEALIGWIETHYPALARKQRPLTIQQAEWLLKKHPVETLRRIIAEMADNPKTSEKEDVYCRMVTFLRWDRQEKTSEPAKYTYEEVCDAVTLRGQKWEHFSPIKGPQGKVLYWVKKETRIS